MKYVGKILVALCISMGLSTGLMAASMGNANVVSNYGEPIAVDIELFDLFDLSPDQIELKAINNKSKGNLTTSENDPGEITFSVFTSKGIGWARVKSEKAVTQGMVELIIEMKTPDSTMRKRFLIRPYGKSVDIKEESPCSSRGKWIKCKE